MVRSADYFGRAHTKSLSLAFGFQLLAGTALAAGYQPLYRFAGLPDGSYPNASPVEDSAGNLYGETSLGGTVCESGQTNGCGVVYKLSSSGQETVLLTFTGPNGLNGNGGLTLIGNTLYGTTVFGGSYNDGLAFSLKTDGTGFTILHEFTPQDGSGPGGRLLNGSNGILYGFTSSGGPGNLGVLYSLKTDGTYTVLHNFSGGADGSYPNSIVLASSGAIIGGAGSVNPLCKGTQCGVVYSYEPSSGILTSLATFAYRLTGISPMVGSVGPTGIIYGATAEGGKGGEGTLFEVGSFNGSYQTTVLWAFSSASGGELPSGGPALTSTGILVGTTYFSEGAGGGALYALVNGTMKTVYDFEETGMGGWQPGGTPLLTSAGTLVGTTRYGGSAGCSGGEGCGVVYTYTPK